MVKRFLNYVDAATNFGLVHVSSRQLLSGFALAVGMNSEQVSAFRNVLEAKGIL